jgi:HK97 gp10 family phage protein
MQFDVDVKGLAEIELKLKLLPQRIGQNAMRRALRKGANVIRDAARSNAKRIDDPETREQIWKNIAVAGGGRRRERAAGGVMMRVGVRGGARPLKKGTDTGLPGGNTTHWRFVEFGTSEARAQPFMRPAGASAAGAAYQAVVAAAPAEIDKELRKLGIT